MNFIKPIAIILLMAIVIGCAQKRDPGFRLVGNVTGFDDGTQLALIETEADSIVDTSVVLNNRFIFTGLVEEPPKEYLIINYF